MRGKLETIVGAMFAGKTSELLKRILWAKHQNKKIIVIKPIIDNRYSQEKIITHNDLSHECFAMKNWDEINKKFKLNKKNVDVAVHTGDITQAKTLKRFSRLNCPLVGVYGNNDLEEKGLEEIVQKYGFKFQNPPFSFEIDNKRIAVFHEPEEIEDYLQTNPSTHAVLHGHTHRYRNEVIGA